MAVVNRFSKGRQSNLIKPTSFQELAIAPQFMRQQHDALDNAAYENKQYSVDAYNTADGELADSQYAKLTDDTEKFTTNLTKNGYNAGMKSDMRALMQEKADLDKNVKAPLEARKQSILAKQAEIDEFFKDDPESKRTASRMLSQANQGSSTFDPATGKLKIPGTQTPEYYKVMGSKEMVELDASAMKLLNEEIRQTNPKMGTITNLPEFMSIMQKENFASISKERVRGILDSVYGQDVHNSLKQTAFNSGLDMDEEAGNNYKHSALNKYGKRLIAGGATEKEVEQELEALSTRKASDLYALLNRKDIIDQKAGVINYENRTSTEKILEDGKALALYKHGLEQKFDLNRPHVPGGIADFAAMNPFEMMEATHKSNIKTMTDDEYLLSKGFYQDEEKRWHYPVTDANAYLGQDNSFAGTIVGDIFGNQAPNNTIVGKRDLVTITTARTAGEFDLEESEEFKTYVNSNPQLQAYNDKNGSKATVQLVTDFYKNIEKSYNSAPILTKNEREGVESLYEGDLHAYGLMTNNGKVQGLQDFESFRENLGYDDDEEFYEKGFKINKLRNVPGQGTVFESTVTDSDGNQQTVYIQPFTELSQSSRRSRAIDDGVRNGESIIPYPSQSVNGAPLYGYAVVDYETKELNVFRSHDPKFDINKYAHTNNKLPDNIEKVPYDVLLHEEENDAVKFMTTATTHGKKL